MNNLGRIIADDILVHRRLLAAAQKDGGAGSWETVLSTPGFWELRHDGMHSVLNMDDKELQQAFVEDLVFARIEAMRGALGSYPFAHPLRHLGMVDEECGRRVVAAVEAVIKTGMANMASGRISIPDAMFERAQEFCGCSLLDPRGADDIVDDMLAVGGSELLADMFDDVASDVENHDTSGLPSP